ncbi:HD family phosphohydrolase [Niallia endozanthoxylica]|uniref:HD family phosphohydrolase n=1 Tax=Niallia endozanthoxylica TaxID=2036016 RepID=A0A5J5HUV4_9BACI|nr:HD family phosphohydrolase [Niallia endozanthoxylica]KAA9026349.1 HD family phosphohydrolase [Niallia endozanthoxylica]
MQQYLIKIRSLLNIKFFRILLFVLLGVVLYISMYSNVKPEKLDIRLFSIANQTIRSPITVEDKKSTAAKKKEAEEQVQDVYVLNKSISENRIDLITSIFDSAVEVNKEIKNEQKEGLMDEGNSPSKEVKLKRLKEKLTVDVTKDIPDSVLTSLVASANDELIIARDLSITAINMIMNNRIPTHEVENAKKKLEEELKYTDLNLDLKNAAIQLGRYAIIPNEFYDPDATEEMRQQAVENVEPVKILEGQIIVEENQLINRDVYRQLDLAGLLDNDRSNAPFIGLTLLIMVFLTALYFYFYHLEENKEQKQTYLLLFSLIFILSIFLMKMVSLLHVLEFADIAFIFPAAMSALLIKILIDEKLAIVVTIIMAICGCVMFNEGVTGSLNTSTGIYILCSGLAGIMFLSNQRRSNIFKAGLFVAAANVVVILSLVFLRNGQYDIQDYIITVVIGFMSGILSAVLTIGLLPFLEAGFGILSTMRLIELSNPNHPLLKKILTETPGTYHHSVMVANLAESACETIGANGLLARVGAYYHDIGKTKRPQFFIENQLNIENPHDRIPPNMSKNIIIAHATDGAEMLKAHHMPKEIVDIAEQHHGTTLLKYFYHKVKQSGVEVDEEEYRYPGPKAQTKESAIVGIADSVEAAVRSMSQPTPEQIEELVRKIISDRLQDNQFNECDLTLKELDKVANALCETLNGIFHSRIEYPEMTKQKVRHA